MTIASELPLSIAVIGSGVSGLSAAWLLSKRHRVTLFEKDARLGGHTHTVTADTEDGPVCVDTGFIVFNEGNYPNLTALLRHLGVASKASDMSFAVSVDGGRLEYSSNDLKAFIGGGRNLFSPRFWSMTRDLWRFYRQAPIEIAATAKGGIITLGDYLDRKGYGEAFQRDHLLPQAAAIWSSSVSDMRQYPACAFVRFFENHGLLRFKGRPKWRTVEGGSQTYVRALQADWNVDVQTGRGAAQVRTQAGGVAVRDAEGREQVFDRVLLACHADQALDLLVEPDAEQAALLSAFRYSRNTAILHTDASLMPRRREAWSSWNYVGDARRSGEGCAVTYWMNRLQKLPTGAQLFVTLNPQRRPAADRILWEGEWEHPCFSPEALVAQQRLWEIQGRGGVWFAGAHFGAGFHEDGLQAGLLAAEQMGGVRRPWIVPEESGRLYLPQPAADLPLAEAA
ncbi:FAD-dependent oxidoreductase [Brevundimonas sp. 2R-24]|uniref:FAD-dependent oxidoreductase n=1 Tax=Peiella sedimenti TaxID=3061083 RepID=A0ABT8SJQ2_9CAUL|nr:FAD-dependent oxidoreductase [Caulobacteraceae bacterium XZ-24]